MKSDKKKSSGDVKKKIIKDAKGFAVAIIIALAIRTFLYEPFRIPSSSMVPGLHIGDFLLVSKSSYGFSDKGTFFDLGV